jgi:hypothetical protein
MRIIIEESVFRDDRGVEHYADILALFRLGLNRHTIEIEPAKSPLFAGWLEQEGARTGRMCRQVLAEGVKRRARTRRMRTVRVADVATATWDTTPRLPVTEAARLLKRPLRILLENGRNDRNFLRIITRLVDGFDLHRLVADEMVEIATNGGIDENRVWIMGLRPEEPHGMWAMCDSDALCAWSWPADRSVPKEFGDGAKKLWEACRDRGVYLHVLQRRAIDNYVPLPVIQQWSFHREDKRKDIYEALVGLSAEQRHHYNMKDGFSAKRDQEYTLRADSIFAKLDAGTRATLEDGLNTRTFSVAGLFDEERLHAEMKIHIFPRWLLQDGQEAEAQRIAQSIRELL